MNARGCAVLVEHINVIFLSVFILEKIVSDPMSKRVDVVDFLFHRLFHILALSRLCTFGQCYFCEMEGLIDRFHNDVSSFLNDSKNITCRDMMWI